MLATDELWIPLHVWVRTLGGDRAGKHKHPAQVHRWRLKGLIPVGGGARVKLYAERRGGRWCCTEQHWREFWRAVEVGDGAQPMFQSARRVERELRAASDDARQRLERLGFKGRQRHGAATQAGAKHRETNDAD